MLGSTHFITGSAIGKLSGNPILAAVFSFFFHFVMDLFPHWDWGYHFKKKISSFLIAGGEPLIGIGIVLWIIFFKNFDQAVAINILVGGFLGILPDILTVFIKTLKIKKLRFFLSFHKKTHWFLENKTDEFEWKTRKVNFFQILSGLIWQIPFWVASVYILMR